jgi:hypothetical protein
MYKCDLYCRPICEDCKLFTLEFVKPCLLYPEMVKISEIDTDLECECFTEIQKYNLVRQMNKLNNTNVKYPKNIKVKSISNKIILLLFITIVIIVYYLM